MGALPSFCLSEYRILLGRLAQNGYLFRPVSDLKRTEEERRVAYMRHDIDFLPECAVAFAQAENGVGCVATYYFMLAGVYNLFLRTNRRVIQQVAELGHEIGLHYDPEGTVFEGGSSA